MNASPFHPHDLPPARAPLALRKRRRLSLLLSWLLMVTAACALPGPAVSAPPLVGALPEKDLARVDAGFGAPQFAPFVFLHFADPQIGKGGPDRIAAQKARFARFVQLANAQRPAFVVIAGDLTDNRTPEEWAVFDEVLARLTVPVVLVPGNHDAGTETERRDYVERCGRNYYAFTYNGCLFVCLDSTLGLESSWNEEAGAQRRFLEQALGAGGDRRHVFIVQHHPPLGDDALLALAVDNGVTAFLCGHVHHTEETRRPDWPVPIYTVSGTAVTYGQGDDYRYGIFAVDLEGYHQVTRAVCTTLDQRVGPVGVALLAGIVLARVASRRKAPSRPDARPGTTKPEERRRNEEKGTADARR